MGKHNIYIPGNAKNKNSFTYCGSTYAVPTGYSAFSLCDFFAGSDKFIPTDLEVFYETTS